MILDLTVNEKEGEGWAKEGVIRSCKYENVCKQNLSSSQCI